MAGETKITLGDTEYTFQRLTIGQLEEITELFEKAEQADGTPRGKIPGEVLRIAAPSATPAIADVRAIPTDLEQLKECMQKLMEHAGLEKVRVGNAPAPAGTAAG